MEIVKAYVRINQTAEVTCPHCQGVTRISIEDLHKKYRSRVTCTCQNEFIAEVDFRDKYRTPVDLPGHYSINSDDTCQPAPQSDSPPNCQVIDLSRNGIGILITNGVPVKEGDILQLDFKLDDANATPICQKCEVCHVKDTYAGCKILNDIKELGIYLLDHTRL